MNLPELITAFKEFTDIKHQDSLNLPLPKHEVITVECTPHPLLEQLMKDVQDGWDEAIKDKTLFTLINQVRTAPQDMRLVIKGAVNHEGSKINHLVKNVKEVYKKDKQRKKAHKQSL